MSTQPRRITIGGRVVQPWQIFLGLGLALIASYLLVPLHLRGAYFGGMSAFGMVGVAFGIHMNRPRRRLPWFLLLAGLGSITLGNAIYALFQFIFDFTASIVPLANLFYVGGYSLLGAALLSLAPSWREAKRTLLDGSIAAIGVAMVWWVFLLDPFFEGSTEPVVTLMTAVAYPIIDLILLGMVVAVLASRSARTITFRIFVLAVVVELAADAVYSVQSLTNSYAMGSALDLLWFITYVLLGTATLHPSMRATKNIRANASLNRLAWFTAPSIVGPILLTVEAARGIDVGTIVVTAMCMMQFLLMMIRFRSAVAEERSLATAKDEAERRYRGLVESLPGILYTATPGTEGEWTYVSPQIESILGFTPAEWTADRHLWYSQLHPDDRAGVMNAEDHLLETGSSPTFDYRMFAKDGRVVWLRDQATVVRDDAGVPKYFQGVMYDITKEKEAEQETARSQARKTAVLETALDCIVTADHDGNIIDFNPAAERTFGYSRDEIVGCSIAETIIPDAARAAHSHGFARFIATGQSEAMGKRLEVVAKRKNGSEFPLELSITAIDDGGRPLLTAYLRDITERREAEEALRASEARFQQAFRNSVSGLAVSNIKRPVAVNPALCDMLGIAESDLLTMEWRTMVHPDDRRRFSRTMSRIVKTGMADRSLSTYRFLHNDGSTVWVEISFSVITESDGTTPNILIQVQDVTLRKEAERSRDRLVATLEAAPDFIGIADASGDLIYLNKGARRMLEIGETEDIRDLSTSEIRPPWAHRLAVEQARPMAARNGTWQGETAFVTRSGEEIPLTQVLVAHKGTDGSVEFYSTIARDLREQKRLEEQFRQAQKMEAVGRLAGGVAHDFNNLLAVIMNYASFLYDEEERDQAKQDLEEIRNAADRGAKLVRQLLAFSRKEVIAPRVVDLNRSVQDVKTLLHRLIGEHVALSVQSGHALKPVRIDPGQVEQILVNLVVNARDAMPNGGTIAIETSNVTVDAKAAKAHAGLAQGDYVRMSVTDNGSGMTEEVRAHIFEPFFTTKGVGQGTGLGLSTVYGSVKQAGGYIAAESEIGHGTVFHIYLPVAAGPVDDEVVPEVRLPVGSGERLLVVEDERGVRDSVVRILTNAGYEVVAAESGPAALEIAKDCSGELDLVLTDVIMPQMSARELADELDAIKPGTKVVFMSGYTDEVIAQYEVLKDTEAFLQKPFSQTDLLEKVREVLDKPSTHLARGGQVPEPGGVLIIEDEEDVLEMVMLALEADNFDVVGAATDGRAGVSLAARLRPKVVVLDQLLPLMTGDRAAPLIRRVAPEAVIVAHSAELQEKPEWCDVFVRKGDVRDLIAVVTEFTAQ